MAGPLNEFTQVSKFLPETFGEPGMRTFRFNVDSGSSNAKVWLEKEQLAELCMAMVQLSKETTESITAPDDPPTHLEAQGLTNLEFKATRLAFGHNPNTGMFIVDAHDPEDDNGEPSIRVWLPRELIAEFANIGLEIVASGRPNCPLCSRPMDTTGHSCPRQNGHSKNPQDLL